nr:hypothetical protein [Bacteroidota bacterium]
MLKNLKSKKKPHLKGIKKKFLTVGACSHLLFHILNREFGHPKEDEEYASDPLAGGIMQQGYQCGLLWGSALAVGAEAYEGVTARIKPSPWP